jgi:GH15 family glucan-1,4-alpha-glucosidase
MDLYSAARRLGRPLVVAQGDDADRLPLGAHGMIGDGRSVALVRMDGAIDWLCLPAFDSPSAFAALLDPQRGGRSAVTPTARPFESLQRYDPDTNVLETLFRIEGQGVVRLTDYMPWTGDPRASIHEVHRRIECREGEVELEAVFDPRFDYGRGRTRVQIGEHGALATGPGGARMVAVIGNGGVWKPRDAGGVRAVFRLRAGQRCWLVLSWGAPRAEPIAAYRPFEHLRATRHAWREWSRGLQYDGPWRHHVMRSALVLKLLIYAPTGGMVAAPTTSLPEWIGGRRNWDYRYVWTRDTALAIRAANRIGYLDEARDFFHFMSDTIDSVGELRVMYSVLGDEVPEERVLEHLDGYANSHPVRVGNDARGQVQLDTAGALLDAAWLYEQFGGSLTLRAWRHLVDVADAVCRGWHQPDHGIWEKRGTTRHNVHSKLMSWVAVERALRIAQRFGGSPARPHWERAAAELREEILKRGLDPRGRHFVSAYGEAEPDAALLTLPMQGLVAPDDPRALATIDWIRDELGDGPYLHRYRSEDGISGCEGAFVLCGFWLAEALAMVGRLEEAQQVFEAHAEASNHLGLLSEEIDPSTSALLGNFPQAFSHLGMINAATRIDRALRLRDEGSEKLPRFLADE